MKYLLIITLLILTSCVTPKTDIVPSPASLNQMRLPLSIDQDKEIGIIGTTDSTRVLRVGTLTSGIVSIRGLKECGYYEEFGYKDKTSQEFDLRNLPQMDVCQYNLLSKSNSLDAPAIGILIVRNYKDPNVVPLKMTVNNKDFTAIGWVQLKEETVIDRNLGITEGRKIALYPSGSKGFVNISGCGITTESYYFDNQNHLWETTLDNLYKQLGSINRSCLFDILVNNEDYLKEGGTILVNVYKGQGSFLGAPVVSTNTWKYTCFEFQDPYVVAICVNKECKGWNKKKMCVDTKGEYEVEGFTSNMRYFYGKYSQGKWEVK